MQQLLLLIILALLGLNASASDSIRESRIARAVEQQLQSGTSLRLPVGQSEFLAIHETSRLPVTKGGAILLHGMAANPDSPEIIRPLRTQLPNSGWSTLSIQMPVAPDVYRLDSYVGLQEEATQRITAAIKFFADRNNRNLVIIAHDTGAAMALNYLVKQPDKRIRAVVLVEPVFPDADSINNLKQVKLPLLDLYGSRGLASNGAAAGQRRTLVLQAGNPGFRQIEVEGADHEFTGLDDLLVIKVRSWLDKYAAGTELPQPASAGSAPPAN